MQQFITKILTKEQRKSEYNKTFILKNVYKMLLIL